MYSAELWTVGTLKKGPIKKKCTSQQLTQTQVTDQPTGKTKRDFQYHFTSSFILNIYI